MKPGWLTASLVRTCHCALALLAAAMLWIQPALAQATLDNPPRDITVERDRTSAQVTVRWTEAEGVDYDRFQLWIGTMNTIPEAGEEPPGSRNQLVTRVPGRSMYTERVPVSRSLLPTRALYFRVRSLQVGEPPIYSRWSDAEEIIVEGTIPNPVINVRVGNQASMRYTVTWENVEQPPDGDRVFSHRATLRYRRTNGNLRELACGSVSRWLEEAVCDLPGDADTSSDEHRVWVVTEGVWKGRVESVSVPFAIGRPDPPGNPRGVVCRDTVSLLWDAPSVPDARGLYGYEVRRRSGGEPGFTTLPGRTFITSHTDTGLAADTDHIYQVRAYDRITHGLWSDEVTVRTAAPGAPGGIPEAPRDLSVNLVPSGIATLSWRAPASAGDCGITGYRIERKEANRPFVHLASLGAVTMFHDFTTEGGSYYSYRVAAVNGNGVGEWARSGVQAAPVPPNVGAPPRPRRFRITPDPEQRRLTFEWSPPDSGHTAITGYVIEQRSDSFTGEKNGDVVASVSAGTFTAFIDDPPVDRKYSYRMRSAGQANFSGYSDVVTFDYRTDIPDPAPVTIPALLARSGALATVGWENAPRPEGDPPIARHRLLLAGTETVCGDAMDGEATSAVCDLPSDSTATHVFVRSESVWGKTADSTAVAVETGPSAPRNLRAEVCFDRIRVTWEPPEHDGGGAIEEYRVLLDGVPMPAAGLPASATEAVYEDLSVGRHSISVEARNSHGFGDSGTLDVTTLPPGGSAPGAPGNARVTYGVGSALLEWDPPAEDGGCAVRSYMVERKAGVGEYAGIGEPTTGTALTDDNVVADVPYVYRIVARNLVGDGAPLEHGPVFTPAADQMAMKLPRNLAVLPERSFARRVTLRWEEPSGGQPDSYVVGRTTANLGIPFNPGEALRMTVAGTVRQAVLQLGQTDNQEYGVKAVYAGAEGDWSDTVEFPLATPPVALANLRVSGSTSNANAANTLTLAWDNVEQPAGEPIIHSHLVRVTVYSSDGTPRQIDCGSVSQSYPPGKNTAECGLPALNELDLAAGNHRAEIRSLDGWLDQSVPAGVTFSLGRPNAPHSLAAHVCSTGVNLSWRPATDDGGSPVTGHELQRRTGAGSYAQVNATLTRFHSYSERGLEPDAVHTYRVRAHNARGPGDWSDEFEVRTGPAGATVPGAPRNIKATFRLGRVRLDWDPPASDGGCPIGAYIVERKVDDGEFELLDGAYGGSHSDADNIVAGTRYAYRMHAVNFFGAGPSVETSPATTSQMEQDGFGLVPQNVRVRRGSLKVVNVTWTDPPSDTVDIAHFVIGRWTAGTFETAPGSGVFFPFEGDVGFFNRYTFTDSGIDGTPGSATEYRVRVVMPDGSHGAWSEQALFVNNDSTPPLPVENVRALHTGAGTIEVRWDSVMQPVREPDIEAHGVFVTLLAPGGGPAPESEVSCVSVTPDFARCEFNPASVDLGSEGHRVVVRSTDYWGGTADSAPARVLIGRPSPPRSPVAGVCHDTARISWGIPAYGTDPGPLRYELQRKAAGGVFSTAASALAGTVHTDGSLSPVTEHTYRVRASNGNGFGEWSPEFSATTGAAGMPTAPGSPEDLTVDLRSDSALVEWSPPQAAGGCEVVSYRVERKTGGPGDFAELGSVFPPVTLFTDRGIELGTEYRYRVIAVAAGAESVPAESGPQTKVRALQDALEEATPGNVAAARNNQRSVVDVTWTAPASGVPVASYLLGRWERGMFGRGRGTTVSVAGDRTANQIRARDLDLSKAWEFRVRAVDAAGEESDWSDPATFRYEDATPPLPVADLSITRLTDSSVTVTWRNVDQGAGEPAIAKHEVVRVVYSGEFGGLRTADKCETSNPGATRLSCIAADRPDAAFSDGNEIFVRSTDVWGKSVDSKRLPLAVGRSTPPLSLEAEVCSTRASLSWEPPADDRGRDITGYEIHRKEGRGSFSLVHTTGTAEPRHVDGTLRPDTTHSYRVRAKSLAGPGEWSDELSVTAGPAGGGAPGAPRNPRVTPSHSGFTVRWDPPASDEGCRISYRLERQAGAGEFEELTLSAEDATTHIDRGTTPGVAHTYRVFAVNLYGETPAEVAGGISPSTSATWAFSIGAGDDHLPTISVAQGSAVSVTVRADGIIHENGENIRRIAASGTSGMVTAEIREMGPGLQVSRSSSQPSCRYTSKDGSGSIGFGLVGGPRLTYQDESDTDEFFLLRCEYVVPIPLSGAGVGDIRTYSLGRFAADNVESNVLQVGAYPGDDENGEIARVTLPLPFTASAIGGATVRVAPGESDIDWNPISLIVTAGAGNEDAATVLAGERVLLGIGDIGFSYSESAPSTEITSFSATERTGRVPVVVSEIGGGGPVFRRAGDIDDRLAFFPLEETAFDTFPDTGMFSGGVASGADLTLSIPEGTSPGVYTITVAPRDAPAAMRAEINGVATGFTTLGLLARNLTVVEDSRPVFPEVSPLVIDVGSQPISHQLPQASGGNGALTHTYEYSWPAALGLAVSEDGLLTGAPTGAGVFRVTVTATDSDNEFLGAPVPGTDANPNDSARVTQTIEVRGTAVRTQALTLTGTVREGGTASITVLLTPIPYSPVTVGFELLDSDGEATGELADPSATPGRFVTQAERVQHVLEISVTDDMLSEGQEVLTVRLTGASIGGATQADLVTVATPPETRVTVPANDPLVVGLAGPPNLAEGTSGVYRITVTEGTSTDTVTVDIGVTGDTDAIVSTLTQARIDPGVPFHEFMIVATGNDQDDDGKSFTVALSSPEGGGGGGISLDQAATSVETAIDDDDFPDIDVTFGAGPYTATEGGVDAMVEVSLSAAPERAITIPVTVSTYTGGAAEGDVSFADATFGATDVIATIEVGAVNDDLDDDDEGVKLAFDTDNLPALVSAGTPATADVAIADNDDPEIEVTFPVMSHTATEGEPDITVVVSLSAAPERDITIPVSVAYSGVPHDPPDALQANVMFAASDLAAEIVIADFDDDVDDDEEEWRLYFGAPLPNRVTAPASTQAGGFAMVSFVDNDDPYVQVAFGSGPHTVTEGGGIEVGVTLDGNPEREVTVPIRVVYLGGTKGADILSVDTSVVFADRNNPEIDVDFETEQVVNIKARDDNVNDDGESVRLEFGDLPDRVSAVPPTTAVVEITDNDPDVTAISLGIEPNSLTEKSDSTQIRVTVSLVGESTLPGDLNVTLTLDGTAASGTDYTGPATLPVATIPAEQPSVVVSFSLAPLEDEVVEGDENIVVDADVPGYTVTEATLPLVDTSEAEIDIDYPDGTLVGEGEEVEFEIEMFGRVAEAITVPWSVTQNPEDVDVADRSGSFTFDPDPSEETTVTITLTVSDDDLSEGLETLQVSLGELVVPDAFGDRVAVFFDTAVANVAASDPLGLSITGPAGADLAEGASAEFIVTVTENTSTGPVTVPLAYSGDATGGSVDYNAPSQVVIAMGDDSRSFSIMAIDDVTDDAGEIVTVSLGTPTGGGGGGFNVVQPASGLPLTIVEDTTAPQFANATEARSVAEHSLAGAAVGAPVTAPGTGLAYSLTGPDSGLFGIVAGSGQITVGAGTELDFDGGRLSYDVTVGVSDGKDARGLPDPVVDDTVGVGIAVADSLDPPGLTLFAATSPTNLTFGWDAPQAGPGGETPATYDVRYRAVGGAWVERNVSGTSLDLSDVSETVAEDTGHEAQVRAVFSDGNDGPYSAIASARTGTTITVSMATLDAEVAEGNAAIGEVALEAAPIAPVTVSYELAAAGIAGTTDAEAGDRTDQNAGAVTLAAGETGAGFIVLVENDNLSETAEAFIVRLTGAESGGGDAPVVATTPAAAATMTVTIPESDPLTVGFRSTAALGVSEGGSIEITIDVTGGVGSADLAVDVDVGGDAAVSDRTVPSSVSVDAGQASVVLTVSATDDSRGDPGETVEVTLTNPTGGGGPAPTLETDATIVVVTIVEDTAAPMFADAGVSRAVEENAAPGNAVGAPVTAPEPYAGAVLAYSLTGADASLFGIGSDSGQITLAAGAPLDHESDPDAYEVTVGVSDGLDARGLPDPSVDDTVDVAIALVDADEPPQAPAAPAVTPVADVAGQTSLSVSWSAPDNEGRPAIDGYGVQYRIGDSGDFTSHTHSGTGTSATIGGLHPGTSYQVQVRAVNDEGEGDWSASGSGSTDQATVSFVAGAHTATEGGAAAVVSVTLSAPPGRAVQIPVTATPVDGAVAADYTIAANAIDFSASQTAGSVTVTADDDLEDDDGEGVTLAFGAPLPDGYAAGTPATASVAIADNDTASGNVGISASRTSVGEGDGDTAIELTATLGGNVSRVTALEVSVSVVSGGTAADDDYDFPLSVINIPAGQLEGSASFTFTPARDDIVEENETVIVGGEADGNAVSTDTITINDDDTAEVSINGPGAAVTEAPGAEAVFTVTLSHQVDREVVVSLSTSDGAAMSGEGDYTARTGAASTVVFGALSPAGETRPFTVAVSEDDLSEGEEAFSVTVTGASPGYGGRVSVPAGTYAEATIAASDPLTLSLSGPASVTEGEPANYRVSVTGGESTEDILVDVSVTPSGATNDDYTAPEPTLTIPAGDDFGTFIIRTTPNEESDDARSLEVSISGPTGGGGGGIEVTTDGDSVNTAINDDDDPEVAVSFASATHTATEGGEGATVSVSLDRDPERTLSVPITVSLDGAETTDYSGIPDSVMFEAGTETVSFVVTATDDSLDEDDDEIVQIGFGAPLPDRVTAGDPDAANVTIADNDTAGTQVTLEVSSTPVGEADTAGAEIAVTARLGGSVARTEPLLVSVAIGSGGTAVDPDDYSVGTLPELTIPAEMLSVSGSFTITPVDDQVVEADETVELTASVAGHTVTPASVTVSDNDTAVVSIGGPASAVTEDSGEAVFTVTLSRSVASAVTVSLSTSDGTAKAGDDYTARTGAASTVVFDELSGADATRPFTVTVSNDILSEGEEEFTVTVSGVGTGHVGRVTVPADTEAEAAIEASDPLTLSLSGPGSVTEGEEAAYEVSVTGGESTEDILVDVSASSTGATVADFTAPPPTLTIGAGDASGAFTIPTAPNDVNDDGKAIEVSISNPTGGGGGGIGVATGSASVDTEIADDDDPDVVVSFESATHTAAEGGAAGAVVTVSLDRDPERELSVPLTVSLSGGAAGTDHSGIPDAVMFDTGAETVSFTVTAEDDMLDESDDEVVQIGFGGLPERVTAGDPAATSVTLTDNDTAGTQVTLEVSRASVGEADTAGVEVSVTARLGGSVARTAPLLVQVVAGSGSATEGADYSVDTLPELTIPAEMLSASGSFTITPVDDQVVEADETVELTASVTDHTVTPASVTVSDNDTAEVSVGGPASAVAEDAGEAVFTVSLSHSVDSPVTVSLSTSDGTATEAGGDYTARSGASVVFGALSGANASESFAVGILDDSVSEIEERLSVLIDSAKSGLAADKVTVGATAAAGAAIAANDPLDLSLSGPATVDEGEVTEDYTLELTGTNTPDGALVVSVTTSGSADADDDYTAPVPVTIASGEVSVLFSIATAEDDIDDDGETIVVGIGDVVSGGSDLTPESSAMTVETAIADDDDPVVTAAFVAEDHSAAEAGEAAVVTVTLDADPERTVSYPLTATPQGAAIPADFTAPTSVTFTTGMTLATFSVVAFDDLFHEPAAEGVSLSLGTPAGDARALVGTPATEEVALADNDDPAQQSIGLSVPPTMLHENSGDAVINVTGTLGGSTAVEADLSVTLTIAGETTAAHNPANSTLPVLVIGPGDLSASVDVTVALTDDAAVGPDTELVLGGDLAGYAVGTVRLAVGENDFAAVSADWVEPAGVAAAVAEGENAVFEFSLDTSVAADVELPWSVVIAGDVTFGDFSGDTDGTVTFGSGGSSAAGTHMVRIAIADDTLFEGTEGMTLSLGALSLSDPSLSGRVSAPPGTVGFSVAPDDSDRVTVDIAGLVEMTYDLAGGESESHPDVLEGQAATFTLSLSGGDATRDISVPLAAGGAGSGHSAQDADFSLPVGPVTLPAGTRAVTFEVSAQADAVHDAGEVVAVSLGVLSGGSPDSSVAPAPSSPAIAAVTIVETNMLPSFPDATVTLSVTENAPAGSAVGDALQATDSDIDDVLSYMLADDPLTPGEDSDLFGIGAQSGQLAVAAGAALDFEISQEHTVTVTARDGRDFRGIADTAADASVVVVVTLGDEPMPPPAAVEVSGQIDSLVVEWGAPATTIVIDGYDVEHRPAGDSGSFTTVSTTDTFVTISGLDRGSGHDVRVIARGGEGASAPSTASGTVPANNPPMYAPASVTLSVPENSPGNAPVGVPQPASDGDGDNLSYSLIGPGRALFDTAAGGQIIVRTDAVLDHESTTQATHVVSLVAADAFTLATLTVTVSVTDVDEPPDAPTGLAVAAPSTDGDTRLVVRWTAPDTAGRPDVSGYVIEHKNVSDPDTAYTAANVTHTGTETSATVSGLEAETDYDVRVRARNDEGDGEWGQVQGRTGAAVSFRVPLANGDPGTSFGHQDALVLFYSLRFGSFLRDNPRLLTLVYNRLFPGQTRDEDAWTSVVLALEELDDPGVIPADHPANVYRKDGSGLDHVDALMIFYSIRFGTFLLDNPRLLRLVFNRLAAVDLTDEELVDLVEAAADLANTL